MAVQEEATFIPQQLTVQQLMDMVDAQETLVYSKSFTDEDGNESFGSFRLVGYNENNIIIVEETFCSDTINYTRVSIENREALTSFYAGMTKADIGYQMEIPCVFYGETLPKRQTDQSSGMDIYAHITETLVIMPRCHALVPTGLFMALPPSVDASVCPRSGLALKVMLTVLNAPGTIDADYRNEVGVILINEGPNPVTINPGERIAQLIVRRYEKATFRTVQKLNETGRKGGFGHTGK